MFAPSPKTLSAFPPGQIRSGDAIARHRVRWVLFHLVSGRTHGGGLPSLGINADQRHSAHPAAADGNHVATSSQVGLHRFWQSLRHRQAPQIGAVLAEGADEMRGGEARGLKCLLRAHAEFHVVEDDLNGCLILLVAASYRDRHYWTVVMEKQCRAQCDSR